MEESENNIENLEKWAAAGKATAELLDFGRKFIKKGAKISEICGEIEKKAKEMNVKMAFPVNVSLNETAAHDTAKPGEERILDDELVKLDLGVEIDGFIGDSAVTIDLSGKHQKLVEASEKALENALKFIKAGVKTGEIGKIIEDTIKSFGFNPVKNLSGHSLEKYNLHSGISIPNYDSGDSRTLEEGMVFAVEPFATTGAGMIEEKGLPQIFSLMKNANVRVGRDVLDEMKEHNILPFSKMQIARKGLSESKINMILRILDTNGMISKYPPLVEISKGIVSQSEHTIIVEKEGCRILTKV